MDSETAQIGRDRLLRVFRYLKALDEHRNPVKRHLGEQLWTLWLKDLPDHPSVRRGVPGVIDSHAPTVSDDGLTAQAPDPDFVLKIARPRLERPAQRCDKVALTGIAYDTSQQGQVADTARHRAQVVHRMCQR